MKLIALAALVGPTAIAALSGQQLRELQTALQVLGYPVGSLDGLVGPRTRNAWAKFKADVHAGDAELIGPASLQTLQAKLQALDDRTGHDFSCPAGTIRAIQHECLSQGLGLNSQIAYVLATVQWETNHTYEPVREAYWLSEDWRQRNLRYYPYYGRGYVQLTWQSNYEKYARLLGIDMVAEPDLAMQPKTALFILVHGFTTGSFTGRCITDYIDARHSDFINCRRVINGTDHAEEIAELARAHLAGMR